MDFSPEQLAALDAASKGPTTLVVVILFTILSFFFVCIRYVSRFAIIKKGSAEDYTIGAAMVRGLCVESTSLVLTLFKIFSIGMAACMIERETLSMDFQKAYADFYRGQIWQWPSCCTSGARQLYRHPEGYSCPTPLRCSSESNHHYSIFTSAYWPTAPPSPLRK
jgi:hypothetical protein